MPIFEYQCEECGVQFEKLYKSISTAPEGRIPCPECGEVAKKLVSAANHSFSHIPTGPFPQNTGVSQIDHNYDRVIGRDAEQKWAAIEKRNAGKDRIIRHEQEAGRGITRDHLVPTAEGPGAYRTVTEPERKSINARRETAVDVRKNITAPSGE